MKQLIISFLVFGFSMVFFSCSENNPSIPFETEDKASSVLMKEGTEIFRFSSENWYSIIDWDAGLRIHIGIPDMAICVGGLDIFDFKYLLLPNNDPGVVDRFVELVKGKNVTAHVRSWPRPSEYASNCEYYAAVPPIASGQVKFVSTDNDYYGWDRNVNNANAYGFKVHGTLEGADGKKYKLNGLYRVTWKGWIDYSVIPAVEHITFFHEHGKINLVPKGK